MIIDFEKILMSFSVGIGVLIALFALFISDQNMELRKNKEKLEFLKLNENVSLAEQIHSEQYGCSFDDGLIPFEEKKKCEELNKVSVYQDKNGNYFLGKEL